MNQKHHWCLSCAIRYSRQLIDRTGRAGVILVDGATDKGFRCAPIDGVLAVLVPHRSPIASGLIDASVDAACEVTVINPEDPAVSLTMWGWIKRLSDTAQRQITDRFAIRHLTTDLLDLGISWNLFSFEAAETHLQLAGHMLTMNAEQSAIALSQCKCALSDNNNSQT